MRFAFRRLNGPKKMVKGKRRLTPVVARISIGRVDIPIPLPNGSSAADSVSAEDDDDSMITK